MHKLKREHNGADSEATKPTSPGMTEDLTTLLWKWIIRVIRRKKGTEIRVSTASKGANHAIATSGGHSGKRFH